MGWGDGSMRAHSTLAEDPAPTSTATPGPSDLMLHSGLLGYLYIHAHTLIQK